MVADLHDVSIFILCYFIFIFINYFDTSCESTIFIDLMSHDSTMLCLTIVAILQFN